MPIQQKKEWTFVKRNVTTSMNKSAEKDL